MLESVLLNSFISSSIAERKSAAAAMDIGFEECFCPQLTAKRITNNVNTLITNNRKYFIIIIFNIIE
jgi:hypothetical protein